MRAATRAACLAGAPIVGWNEVAAGREIKSYTEMAAAEEAALGTLTDAEAAAARQVVDDLVPTIAPED